MATGQIRSGKVQNKITPHKVYIGIDPGKSGGLACISGEVVESISMPDTERDTWYWFKELREDFPTSTLIGVIEKVGGYIPRQGKGGKKEGQPGSSMFKFGASTGGLRMALIASGVIFDEIPPKQWQKFVGVIGIKEETKTQFKNRLKAKAQQLFPEQRVTLATADALLIAYYCKHSKRVAS